MITLLYFDNVGLVADLDDARDSLRLRIGPVPPVWAEVAGRFAILGYRFVGVARIEGELQFLIDSTRLPWSSVVIDLGPRGIDGSRTIQISASDGMHWDVAYFPASPIAGDPTPVEDEDLDFGEFLVALKTDPARAARIWM